MIEVETGNDLIHLRRNLRKLHNNFKSTRRKSFKAYSKYIEPALHSIVTHHDENNWNFFWKRSSITTKMQFLYILFLPLAFYLALILEFTNEEFSDEFQIALIPMIFAVILMSAILVVTNILLYYFIIGLFLLFKYESGVLNRNITALEAVSNSTIFYRNYAIILGIGGILASSALNKLGGFKGMGGGKFGGSGAGGSW